MTFDGFFTHSMVKELNDTLTSGRVMRVNQPYPAEMIMVVRAHRHNYSLLVSANPTYPRIQITNIPRTTALIEYEKYINDTYDLQTLTNEDDWKNPKWVEWDKPKGKILDAYHMILKANRIG